MNAFWVFGDLRLGLYFPSILGLLYRFHLKNVHCFSLHKENSPCSEDSHGDATDPKEDKEGGRSHLSWSREVETQRLGRLQGFWVHCVFRLSLLEPRISFLTSLRHFRWTPLRCTHWSSYHFPILCYICRKFRGPQGWGPCSGACPLSSAWWCRFLELWCLL